MLPSDRPLLLPALTEHLIGEVEKIAAAIPNNRVTLQWDVCQEVLAWEGYYEEGPVDFRSETLEVLTKIGDAMPAAIELGYHLCYGSPADEHLVQAKDMAIMAEMASGICAGVGRSIQFFHMPVPKNRTDDAYFAPLKEFRLHPETGLYLGLIHYNDARGDAARLTATRRYARVDALTAWRRNAGWRAATQRGFLNFLPRMSAPRKSALSGTSAETCRDLVGLLAGPRPRISLPLARRRHNIPLPRRDSKCRFPVAIHPQLPPGTERSYGAGGETSYQGVKR
jgi:hypothetical protein